MGIDPDEADEWVFSTYLSTSYLIPSELEDRFREVTEKARKADERSDRQRELHQMFDDEFKRYRCEPNHLVIKDFEKVN